MAELTTTDKLAALVEDCLESKGTPEMIAPMLKAAHVLATDEELAGVAGLLTRRNKKV